MLRKENPISRAAEATLFGLVRLLVLGFCCLSPLAWASEFIDLRPKTDAEVSLILDTLEGVVNEDAQANVPPIVMMLHGDQAHRFLRNNYNQNKMLIDQTAKLAAYGVIDVQICETWMQKNDYTQADLFPFIQGVPLGAAELKRLQDDEGYDEYSVNL